MTPNELLRWAKKHHECADFCLDCPIQKSCEPMEWQGLRLWPCDFVHKLVQDLGIVAELSGATQ